MMQEQEDIIKVNNYIEQIKKMDKDELKYELELYIKLINGLENQYSLQRDLINALNIYIEKGLLNTYHKNDLDKNYEEAIYEKAYLYNLKYIAKKMKKNITNIDLYNIYLCIVNLNYTNDSRAKYLTSMYNYIFSNGMINNIKETNNTELLEEVSNNLNKMFKIIKKRKGIIL